MRALFPTRALSLLLAIGLLDLVATAMLNAQGRIEELNPLMAPVLHAGSGTFVGVKAATLGVAWAILVHQAKDDVRWVRRACYGGSAAYLALLAFALVQR